MNSHSEIIRKLRDIKHLHFILNSSQVEELKKRGFKLSLPLKVFRLPIKKGFSLYEIKSIPWDSKEMTNMENEGKTPKAWGKMIIQLGKGEGLNHEIEYLEISIACYQEGLRIVSTFDFKKNETNTEFDLR